MSTNEKDALPPPYSQSTHSLPTASSNRGQNLLDQLTLVRTQHLRSTINKHILPIVDEQATYGIAKTIIALVPSDVSIPAPEEKSEFSFDANVSAHKVEVVGFSSDESPKMVRLEGQLDKTEFWRPQTVLDELERRLNEELNASMRLRPKTPEKEERPLRQSKRSFFNRVSGRGAEVPPPSGDPEVGVRQVDVAGQVLVTVRLEEICLRTVTDFGLYDTVSKQCVVIRVDARC
jgi:hypothetical protein